MKKCVLITLAEWIYLGDILLEILSVKISASLPAFNPKKRIKQPWNAIMLEGMILNSISGKLDRYISTHISLLGTSCHKVRHLAPCNALPGTDVGK